MTVVTTDFGEFGPASLTTWEEAQSHFEEALGAQRLRIADVNRDIAPNLRERPRGCVDAVQGQGTDWTLSLVSFPIGYTACLTMTGEVITVIFSGEYRGMTGVAASNLVVEIIGDYLAGQ